MQETEIKVSFNDGGMMQQLQDMLTMLDDIQDRAGGVEMPNQRGGGGLGGTGVQGADRLENSIESFFNQFTDTLVNSAGASVGSAVRNVTGLISNAVKQIPVVGEIAGGLVGAYGQLKASSLEKRQEIANQIMNLEGLEAQIMGLTGESGRDIAEKETGRLTELGFTPEETRSLLVGIGQSFGRGMTGQDIGMISQDLAVMQRTGINAQSVASLAGAIQQGTGQETAKTFDTSFQAVAIANQLGLVGAGVDQFTGSLNSMFSDLTQKGIRFDPKDILKFSQGVGNAFKDEMAGMRPLQIAQSLAGVAGGARSSFAGNFSQLASTAIQAKAFSQASSPLEAMRIMEEIQADPELVRKIIIEAFGRGEASETILASIEGIGTRDAKFLTGRKQISKPMLPKTQRFDPVDVKEAMPLAGAQAEEARLTLEKGRKDEKTMQTMIELQGKMDRTLLKFSENEETVLKVYELMIKALEKIEKLIP